MAETTQFSFGLQELTEMAHQISRAYYRQMDDRRRI